MKMPQPTDDTRAYLARIGRKGGTVSRRVLTREQAQTMVKTREAKRKKR